MQSIFGCQEIFHFYIKKSVSFLKFNIMNSAGVNIETSLLGFTTLHPTLTYVKNYNIIIKTTHNNKDNNVKLISGGGSGHEPSHIGWVGNGMLSAAVCGNIFASPSVTR